MVTGSGPQSKVMMPPAATAATTAAEVQLAGVPLPIRPGRVRGVDRPGLGRHRRATVRVARLQRRPAARRLRCGARLRGTESGTSGRGGRGPGARPGGGTGRRHGPRATPVRTGGPARGQGRGDDTEDEQGDKRLHAHPPMLGARRSPHEFPPDP